MDEEDEAVAMFCLAFPGFTYSEVMNMTYRQRDNFWRVYKRVNK